MASPFVAMASVLTAPAWTPKGCKTELPVWLFREVSGNSFACFWGPGNTPLLKAGDSEGPKGDDYAVGLAAVARAAPDVGALDTWRLLCSSFLGQYIKKKELHWSL